MLPAPAAIGLQSTARSATVQPNHGLSVAAAKRKTPWFSQPSTQRPHWATRATGAGVAIGVVACSVRRRRLSSMQATVTGADQARDESPLFCSAVSAQKDWRAAVEEVAAEASYQSRNSEDNKWNFGVVFVRGYDDQATVSDIAAELDGKLGTGGGLLGVAVEGTSGISSDGTHKSFSSERGDGPSLQLIAAKLPRSQSTSVGSSGFEGALPFCINKSGLQDVSMLVMKLQARVRVRGAVENPTPRAWREYIGVQDGRQPKGVLLFIDPLASKYVVNQALAGLDLAMPRALKFGGVAADLPSSLSRLAARVKGKWIESDGDFGVVGIVLPDCVAPHAINSPGCVRVGPELRLTRAQGQVVSEFNDEPASEALGSFLEDAGPLERLLIERSGLLIGLEAPRQPPDPDRSQEWDDVWGSSERAPAYATLQRQAMAGDWVVRALEPMPDGTVVVRREDLKSVPPRVGPAWLRCQMHVHDSRWAHDEFKLMLQRYAASRMMTTKLGQPIGAFICRCACKEVEDEFGLKEVRELFGDRLPVASVATNGEISPPGVTIGGVDKCATTRQGHSSSVYVLNYLPSES